MIDFSYLNRLFCAWIWVIALVLTVYILTEIMPRQQYPKHANAQGRIVGRP